MSTTAVMPATANLTPTQNQIIAMLAGGASVTAAASQLNLHRTTIHQWKRTNPEFAVALQDAKEDAADHHRAECHQHANLALDSLVQLLEDPKTPASVRLKAALHILHGATGQPPSRPPKPLAAPPVQQNSSLSSPVVIPANQPYVRPTPKVGRNEKCPCGSGRKYKACCLTNSQPERSRTTLAPDSSRATQSTPAHPAAR